MILCYLLVEVVHQIIWIRFAWLPSWLGSLEAGGYSKHLDLNVSGHNLWKCQKFWHFKNLKCLWLSFVLNLLQVRYYMLMHLMNNVLVCQCPLLYEQNCSLCSYGIKTIKSGPQGYVPPDKLVYEVKRSPCQSCLPVLLLAAFAL